MILLDDNSAFLFSGWYILKNQVEIHSLLILFSPNPTYDKLPGTEISDDHPNLYTGNTLETLPFPKATD